MTIHKIRVRTVEGARYYEVRPGVYLRSVTTILGVISKPWLLPWAANIGAVEAMKFLRPYVGMTVTEEVLRGVDHAVRKAHLSARDSSADYGTLVHEAVAAAARGLPVESLQMLPVVERFKEFLAREKIEPVLVEEIVYSEKEGIYGGTVDLVGRRTTAPGVGGIVVDWKSSNAIYPDHILQVAAYAKALEERLGIPFREAWVVRCNNKNGELDYEERGIFGIDLDKAFQTFKAAQVLDDGLRQLREMLKL